MRSLTTVPLGQRYILNVFDFEADEAFVPISRRNVNLASFAIGFRNFVAYAFEGSFVRQSSAVTKDSVKTGKGLYFTTINKGESLAKADSEGNMADVIHFTMVRYRALEKAKYICVGHQSPFVDTPIARTEVPLLPNIPFTVKANTVVLFPDPETIMVNGTKPEFPFATSGTVTSSASSRLIEVPYGV